MAPAVAGLPDHLAPPCEAQLPPGKPRTDDVTEPGDLRPRHPPI
jgi:hypothetical protein